LVIYTPSSTSGSATQILQRIPLPVGSLATGYSLAIANSILELPPSKVRYDICEAGSVPTYPYNFFGLVPTGAVNANGIPITVVNPCLETLGAPVVKDGQPRLSVNYAYVPFPSHLPAYCDSYMTSPLVLDLHMDGVRTLPVEAGTRFDIDGMGNAVRVGWIAPGDDAFLVLDLNRNGRIDSGAELFGNATRLPNGNLASNGFEALAQYDGDKNRRIDRKDPVYSQLGLWTDTNSDGVSQSNELTSLSSQQIEFISLENIEVAEIDVNGNRTLQRSYFQKPSVFGKNIGIIADIWFKVLE
jgi:hypothetical protein